MTKECPQIRIVRRRAFAHVLDPAFKAELKNRTRKGITLDYNNTEGTLLRETADELLKRIDTQQKVHVLDAGAGKGNILKVVEGFASGDVYAHGIALHGPDPKAKIDQKNWTKGHFETTMFLHPEKETGAFDIIQSAFGLQHAANVVAYENMLNSLKKDGKLIVQNDSRNPPLSMQHSESARMIVEMLKNSGFAIESKPNRRGFVEAYTRTNDKKVDLSQFYDCAYLNKVPLKRTLK